MPRVDDLVSCQGLVRALEDLRAKLGTYVAGRGPRGTPSMGWVASRVLERLALYSGGITEPVLLTELQQLWHGGEEIDWSRAEGPQAQPLPVEASLKRNCPSNCTFSGCVVGGPSGESGDGLPQYVEVASTRPGEGDVERARGVRLILPLALRTRLRTRPGLLVPGRGVTFGDSKSLRVGKEYFLLPTESILFAIDAGDDEDRKYLSERHGVTLERSEPKLTFEESFTAPTTDPIAVVCCKIVSVVRDGGGGMADPSNATSGSVAVEILKSNEEGIPACEVDLVLHQCQRALANMVQGGDHLVIEVPRGRAKISVIPQGSGPRTKGALTCPRGSVFHRINFTNAEPFVASSSDKVEFRTLDSVSSPCENVTVIGVVMGVKGGQKGLQSPSDCARYEISLRDAEGGADIEVTFEDKWSAGLLERGHMIALTGVAARWAESQDTSGRLMLTWKEALEGSLYNLSTMHSRLYTTFLSPNETKSLPQKRSAVKLLKFKNIQVRPLHRRCLRMVQNVVIDFFGDDNDIECCTASTGPVAQTPETPSKSGGLYECCFCRSDCCADDVVLGYTGGLEVETDGGVVSASVDASALRKIIQMEPVHYKRSSKAKRKAHLDTMIGQDLTVLFYRSPQGFSARKKILEESSRVNNADQTNLCISIVAR